MLARLETKVPPVVWALLAMALVFVLSTVINDELVPDGRGRVIAGLIALCGLIVAVSAVAGFGQAKTSVDPHTVGKASTLVTGGVYRFTRNPMYLGLLCFIIAFGLWRGDAFPTLIGAGAFVAVLNRVQIIPEERFLAKRFGAPYRDFKSSVRRWI